MIEQTRERDEDGVTLNGEQKCSTMDGLHNVIDTDGLSYHTKSPFTISIIHECLKLTIPFPFLTPFIFQTLYQQRLLSEGISQGEIKSLSNNANAVLNKAYEESKTFKSHQLDWLSGTWKGLKGQKEYSAPQPTGVDEEILAQIGQKLTQLPEGFKPHSRLANILKAKEKMITEKKGIDYATAEALAFGSLLLENKHIRLSGQDVERGTFSHRHALLHDQNSDATYVPLNNILPQKQAHFTVANSSLSEYGVLGFELGYSLENPHALVLWEAQFGDFFNTAQVIVDQFISSGEDKWSVESNKLHHFLPHTASCRTLSDSL